MRLVGLLGFMRLGAIGRPGAGVARLGWAGGEKKKLFTKGWIGALIYSGNFNIDLIAESVTMKDDKRIYTLSKEKPRGRNDEASYYCNLEADG